MRTFHWLLLLTLTPFLGAVVAAEQASPKAAAPAAAKPAAAAPAPAVLVGKLKPKTGGPAGFSPKAPMKDIMNAMIVPSSTIVFGAVSTITDATGVHDMAPQTDDDWKAIYNNAVMLAEAANLLMVPGRQRWLGGAIPMQYRQDFAQKARELVEAGNDALVAAQKHSPEGISDAGERIDVACDECHEKYQLVEGDPNTGKVFGTFKPGAAPKK